MRASGVVLRRASVRVRGVRVLHVSAAGPGHVRVAGRACAPAGRGMTARGPGAPAAAAAPRPASPAPRARPPSTHHDKFRIAFERGTADRHLLPPVICKNRENRAHALTVHDKCQILAFLLLVVSAKRYRARYL